MFELGMSINQILGLEDFNGIGPDGDERFVSNNVQTLKNAVAGPAEPPPLDLTDPAAVAASFRLN
jgi:hypothetical protein